MRKSIIAVLTLLFATVLMSFAPVFAATCAVDPSTKYQTMDGFGAASVWVGSKITASLADTFKLGT